MSTQYEIEDERVWREVLLFWKKMSETPDEVVKNKCIDFKNDVLNKLGIDDMKCGCPFCERYNTGSGTTCDGCPLQKYAADAYGGCYDTPYRAWYDAFDVTERHSQEAAGEFYRFLVKEYKDSHI